MSIFAWLCAASFTLILVVILRMSRRGLTDIVTIVVFSFALFYGFRTWLLATGLDTPTPANLFRSSTLEADYRRAVLGACMFLVATAVGVYATTRTQATGFAPFLLTRPPVPGRQLAVTVAITAISIVISLYLLSRFGSVGRLIGAAKYDKALAGYFVFRVFPAVGSIVAVGAFLDLRRERRSAAALVCLGCAATNGAAVFLWGSRGILVASLMILAIGLSRGRRSSTSLGRRAVAAVLVAVVVVGSAAVLRVVRDTLTHGETQSVVADASPWRQASLSTNAVYLDAAILAFRDFPERFQMRSGEDFANGLQGFVPRSIWPDKPTNLAPGSWFRRSYQPRVVNGWPMGAPALWYLNFGWLGVAAGGLLSGLAVGLISARQRNTSDLGHNLAATVAAGLFVFGLGWDSQTPYYILLWLVPLWMVRRVIESGDTPSTPLPNRPPAMVEGV
jgi:oligosaccharide repeat unit polymerase